MARLKVFTWSDGFHAYTVATTSRAKALAAWGVTRDLFKDGEASELSEGTDRDAALSHPGSTIRRGLNVDVGKVKAVGKPKAPRAADVERVAALERDLAALEAEQDAARASVIEKRESLDRDEAALDRAYAKELIGTRARLKTARIRLKR